MSNVLARKRGISEMEFYHNADDLRTELTALLMREKVVPKRWRHVITYRALDTMQNMMNSMHRANRIYANTPESAAARLKAQDECIECCDQLYEILQNAIRNVWWQKLHAVNPSTLEPTKERLALEAHLTVIGNLIDREEQLLKGWKRDTKRFAAKTQ